MTFNVEVVRERSKRIPFDSTISRFVCDGCNVTTTGCFGPDTLPLGWVGLRDRGQTLHAHNDECRLKVQARIQK